MRKPSIKAVIVAAGSGTRFNSSGNKPYVRLGRLPLLCHCLKTLDSHPQIDEIVIVAAKSKLAYCRREIVAKYAFSKVSAVVAGGAERQLSVKNGLAALDCAPNDIVLIHDGARPFAAPGLISGIIAAARKHGAAVPGTRPKATIKQVNANSMVTASPARSALREVQTPQGFRYKVLAAAYSLPERVLKTLTDDASVVERAGAKVKVADADESNIKITTAFDLEIGELILKKRKGGRTG